MFVGHQKGRNLAERTACNFGCAHPEGYRKALREDGLAAGSGLPIVCLIDTPGAYPGIEAEERGQAAIIAENLMAMSQLDTPIVCVVIGEGGSGGALGIGIGDRVGDDGARLLLGHQPRGLRHDPLEDAPSKKDQAAEALKMTGRDLLRFGIIDEVIEEPPGGAHRDPRGAGDEPEGVPQSARSRRSARSPATDLLDHRYEKFRRIGEFFEAPPAEAEAEAEAVGEAEAPPTEAVNGAPTRAAGLRAGRRQKPPASMLASRTLAIRSRHSSRWARVASSALPSRFRPASMRSRISLRCSRARLRASAGTGVIPKK